mgnify:CR=1 FL=1
MNLFNIETIERSIRRFRLRVIRREDDGAFRVYTMARAGSGSRGGAYRNLRHIRVTAADDCRLRAAGLLKTMGGIGGPKFL